jgi:uncharacterized protein (DUF433 family)
MVDLKTRNTRELEKRSNMAGHALTKEKTNHAFVVKKKDVCDGSPIIEGTRTRVIDIAIEYEMLGHSPDEIARSHPHLGLSQIHDALSYYYENRHELDQRIELDQRLIEKLKKEFPSKMT